MTFSEFNLTNPLRNALDEAGFVQPTVIQEKTFSAMMSGRDVVGIAQTGTGKTLAYLLPCLRQWVFTKERMPQIMVIVPTRELVVQVVDEVKKLTTYMNVKCVGVFGGTNINTQAQEVLLGVDVLVGTPGRIYDLTLHGSLRLKSIKRLIIDEVDEMLNLGFRHQLIQIFDLLPNKRQNLMFSATMTDDILDMINDFFNNPLQIEAARMGTPLDNIVQIGYSVPNFYTKLNFLRDLLTDEESFEKVLVFASSKKQADEIYEFLEDDYDEELGVIHSNKAQNNRFNTVKSFESGAVRILVATDIMARGLDITNITHVINFEVPEVAENYIHRIGRTGRADKNGVAITFVTPRDAEKVLAIEVLMDTVLPMQEMPEEVEISDEMHESERPVIAMKNILTKIPDRESVGPAFHEKSEKNKKVNNKIRFKDKMWAKYGKPKTRGQKKKGK